MEKQKKTIKNAAGEELIWRDRKRILGMPISFTVYEVDSDRLTVHRGLFTTTTNELLLYRVLDLQTKRTLSQKLFGVGTLTLFCADQSNRELQLQNIRKPEAVRRFLSKLIESQRAAHGVTGREMFGTAGAAHECGNLDLTDVDGDGIPG